MTLPYGSKQEAETALAAIQPDNDGYVDASVSGSDLVLKFSSETTMGLLRSIDDVLGCLRSIEQAS